MIINIKAVDEESLSLGDAFLCKNSKEIRFIGYDQATDKVVVLDTSFDVVNRYDKVSEIAEHYTINKIIKNDKIIISEVNENE